MSAAVENPAMEISTAGKIDPLDLLYDRCCTLCDRVIAGQLGFIEAVDLGYSAAQWAGLCESAGEDAVQAVLAAAFVGARPA